MRRISTQKTPYQTIEIWGNADEVEFRVAGAIHAWWHRQQFLTGLAWDCLCAASLLRPGPEPKKFLMLGLGGGTTIRSLHFLMPRLQFTAVELDEGMLDLARQHMALDKLPVNVIHGDAYSYLQDTKETFDVILDDVYSSGAEDVMRSTAYDAPLTKALKRRLAPGGIFIANLVTGTGHRRTQTQFRQFFKNEFPVVRTIRTPGSLNEALIGGVDVLPASALKPYAHLWPLKKDRHFWSQLQCRRL